MVTPSSDSSVKVLPENLKIYGVVKEGVVCKILLRMTGTCDVCIRD